MSFDTVSSFICMLSVIMSVITGRDVTDIGDNMTITGCDFSDSVCDNDMS